jgi:dipeptidyl aminopeptidase/acylaminoacyl peptidase
VPLYSPDGRWLAFAQQRTKGFYGDLRRLMLIDRRSGAVREVVGDAWDRSADGLVWAPDSKRLYGTIDDSGSVRVYEIPLEGKPRLITGDETFSSLAIASQNGTMVGLRQTFLEPPTVVRIDPKAGKVTKLSTLNDALLAGTALGTYESVTYTGANGKPIQMWVNYPPGFDKSKKYPLFMLIHGGPHNAITNAMQFRWNAQVFGSWGYVTGWPNFHGSSGFGNAFTDSINPQQEALPYKDVIAAADWFAQQPWIDSGRMVAGGGSYGGYLTSIILGRSASLQGARGACRRVQLVHAGRRRLFLRAAALRRLLDARAAGGVPRGLAALRRREFRHAHAGRARPERPARAGEPRHRALPRPAAEGRANAPRVLQGREPLGAQAGQLAGLVP